MCVEKTPRVCKSAAGNFPWVHYENCNLLSPSSAVTPGNWVLTVDETHVDDIIFLSLGNAIKLSGPCGATPSTTLHSHLPSAVYTAIHILNIDVRAVMEKIIISVKHPSTRYRAAAKAKASEIDLWIVVRF